ncbi:hypothetical protein JCM10369A_02480 [Nocardioides pyridinolyticus]
MEPTLPNGTERKTATPSVPPIWRENVAELVATPISPGGTALCTMSSSGCMQLPRPRPSTNIARLTKSWAVSAPHRDSRNSPTTITPDPTIGNNRTWPVREMTWPDPIDDAIMPTTIGSISSPDSVGVAPCTICM